jgi:hypothetical protein
MGLPMKASSLGLPTPSDSTPEYYIIRFEHKLIQQHRYVVFQKGQTKYNAVGDSHVPFDDADALAKLHEMLRPIKELAIWVDWTRRGYVLFTCRSSTPSPVVSRPPLPAVAQPAPKVSRPLDARVPEFCPRGLSPASSHGSSEATMVGIAAPPATPALLLDWFCARPNSIKQKLAAAAPIYWGTIAMAEWLDDNSIDSSAFQSPVFDEGYHASTGGNVDHWYASALATVANAGPAVIG